MKLSGNLIESIEPLVGIYMPQLRKLDLCIFYQYNSKQSNNKYNFPPQTSMPISQFFEHKQQPAALYSCHSLLTSNPLTSFLLQKQQHLHSRIRRIIPIIHIQKPVIIKIKLHKQPMCCIFVQNERQNSMRFNCSQN